MVVDDIGYTPINNFTTVELGCEKGNVISTTIVKDQSLARTLISDFDEIWNDKKVLQDVTDEVIENIKASLMGPTAGIGDAFFFNCLRVIAAGIGIGLCEQGNILGTFLFILIYGVSQLVGRWYLLRIGYSFGTSFIDSIFESGLMEPLTKSAGIVGLTMVGAMVATTVKVKLNWTIAVGQTSVVVLDIIESIMPGLLSIVLVFVLVRLIKKGVKPITLVFGILALTILLAAVGVF